VAAPPGAWNCSRLVQIRPMWSGNGGPGQDQTYFLSHTFDATGSDAPGGCNGRPQTTGSSFLSDVDTQLWQECSRSDPQHPGRLIRTYKNQRSNTFLMAGVPGDKGEAFVYCTGT